MSRTRTPLRSRPVPPGRRAPEVAGRLPPPGHRRGYRGRGRDAWLVALVAVLVAAMVLSLRQGLAAAGRRGGFGRGFPPRPPRGVPVPSPRRPARPPPPAPPSGRLPALFPRCAACPPSRPRWPTTPAWRPEVSAPPSSPIRRWRPPSPCLAVADAGVPVYGRQVGVPEVPAANLKLLTAFAVLTLAGADRHAFTTRVVAGAPPVNGVIDGPLWLVGGGDPLLGTPGWRASEQRLDREGRARDQPRRAGRRPCRRPGSPASPAGSSVTTPASRICGAALLEILVPGRTARSGPVGAPRGRRRLPPPSRTGPGPTRPRRPRPRSRRCWPAHGVEGLGTGGVARLRPLRGQVPVAAGVLTPADRDRRRGCVRESDNLAARDAAQGHGL